MVCRTSERSHNAAHHEQAAQVTSVVAAVDGNHVVEERTANAAHHAERSRNVTSVVATLDCHHSSSVVGTSLEVAHHTRNLATHVSGHVAGVVAIGVGVARNVICAHACRRQKVCLGGCHHSDVTSVVAAFHHLLGVG